MAQPVQPIPPGYTSVTPHLIVQNAAAAIGFYKQAFGAEELFRKAGKNGKIMHAELKIGTAVVMLADEYDPHPGHEEHCAKAPVSVGRATSSFYLYVENVDNRFKQAVSAGAQPTMPPTDMFYGDRVAQVKDPSGHLWSIATHTEDVKPEDLDRRMQEFFAQQPGCP